MFRVTMYPSSGETTVLVFMQHLVLVILYEWLSGMHGGMHSTLHTRQLSTQNNKYQVSHKYSCSSWWWARSRPKHVEKWNKQSKKMCTKLVLFTRLYRDARSTKHKIPLSVFKNHHMELSEVLDTLYWLWTFLSLSFWHIFESGKNYQAFFVINIKTVGE